jgi:hypothetical protein
LKLWERYFEITLLLAEKNAKASSNKKIQNFLFFFIAENLTAQFYASIRKINERKIAELYFQMWIFIWRKPRWLA